MLLIIWRAAAILAAFYFLLLFLDLCSGHCTFAEYSSLKFPCLFPPKKHYRLPVGSNAHRHWSKHHRKESYHNHTMKDAWPKFLNFAPRYYKSPGLYPIVSVGSWKALWSSKGFHEQKGEGGEAIFLLSLSSLCSPKICFTEQQAAMIWKVAQQAVGEKRNWQISLPFPFHSQKYLLKQRALHKQRDTNGCNLISGCMCQRFNN